MFFVVVLATLHNVDVKIEIMELPPLEIAWKLKKRFINEIVKTYHTPTYGELQIKAPVGHVWMLN